MNTDRELMQQALEALEFYYDQHGEESDAKVITALRDRLAQPVQEPVAGEPLPCPFCGVTELCFADGSTHRWGIASCGNCGATAGETRREYPDKGEWHKEAIAEWNRRASPPAQRKPLTDEEIDALVLDKDGLPNSHIEFARAIERAHGIGEKPDAA